MNNDQLRQWATPRESEYLDALEKFGGQRSAAKMLRVSRTAIQSSMNSLKKRAAKHGYSPEHDMTKTVPDGYMVKGVSTYYNKEGKPSAQWVKSTVDHERMEVIMREAVAAMCEGIPAQPSIPAPEFTNDCLANVYTLTDSHVGMLAWHKENLDANGDWDLTIAERTLVGCFKHMVDASPQARVGIVAQLGDYLHTDGLQALTPSSGHVLDADGRFPKIVKTAIRVLRTIINFALERHEKVIVLLAEGNHDMASSVWLRAMFSALYENEPRVQVIDSEMPYYVYQHGKTMIAWHHGHLSKMESLPLLFASQFPRMWGDTVKRYAHCGHRHHVDIKEHSGITVTQHSTLAARDAYASRGGWMSERQCVVITYHSEFGQVAQNTVTPEMLKAA